MYTSVDTFYGIKVDINPIIENIIIYDTAVYNVNSLFKIGSIIP